MDKPPCLDISFFMARNQDIVNGISTQKQKVNHARELMSRFGQDPSSVRTEDVVVAVRAADRTSKGKADGIRDSFYSLVEDLGQDFLVEVTAIEFDLTKEQASLKLDREAILRGGRATAKRILDGEKTTYVKGDLARLLSPAEQGSSQNVPGVAAAKSLPTAGRTL